ncbi:MAG: M23 family metallopeptidase [Oscillospiraceae bacterium]
MDNKQDLQPRDLQPRDIPIRKANEQPRKSPKDYMVYMITVQTVLCILLFVVLLIFSRIGGDSYTDFKQQLSTIMSNDMGIGGLKSAFQNAVDFVMAPSDQWKAQPEKTTQVDNTTTNVIPQKSGGTEMGMGMLSEISENGKAPQNASFAPYTITAKITNPLPMGKISSSFGFRNDPITGKYGFHSGLDIAAKSGSRIAAAYSGKVMQTGKNSIAGNFVALEHGGGLVTFYCHCSEILAADGENIRAGETIAKVGSTGYSTGPHLHFEIRINGVKYNPILAFTE